MGEPRRAASREPFGRPYLSDGDAVMEEFTLGARASCPDGFCGVVSGTIVDPAARTVTHEFGRLDPGEKVLGDTWSGAGDYSSLGLGQGRRRPLVVGHAVPLGEKVTRILLEEGHLWGRKQVAIPVSSVASIEDGIRLNITKRQVEDLPPLGQSG